MPTCVHKFKLGPADFLVRRPAGKSSCCTISVFSFPVRAKVGDSSSDDDEWSTFGDEFDGVFDEMEEEERVYSRLDAGFENWEERCLKIGGQRALDDWLKSQEDLVYCVLQNFDKDAIKQEVEAKKETGDLDLVFKKYCE